MRVLFAIIFIFLVYIGFAQENKTSFSLELNPKITGLSGTKSPKGEQEKAFSFELSGLGTYKVSKTIDLSLGLGYGLSNFHYKDQSITVSSDFDPTTGGDYEKTYLAKKIRRHYLTVPVRISFNLGEKSKHALFLGAGIFLPISQTQEGEFHSQSDPNINGTFNNYRQEDAPSFINAQLGYNYKVNKSLYLGVKFEFNKVELDYLNSFGSTFFGAPESAPSYYTNLGITLGYRFK